MRIPESLSSLLDDGILQDVIRPLMSGKEAQVYLVVSEGEERVAKVYKEAQNRTFKNRAEYTEGRKTRNSRDQRAMAKRSKHGRQQDEAAWRSTEVDMIYRLRHAGVRVPTPYHFIDGVLVMELVKGPQNLPAPRLGDLAFSAEEAKALFAQLIKEVVRMLCAGVVHGDLSDFNVLMDAQGPVIIDFPQAVEAAGNQNARKLLLRDVANLQNFVNRFAPTLPALPYAQEMWALYESGDLTPTTELTGHYAPSNKAADTDAVLSSIDDAQFDERRRREARGLSTRGMGGTPAPHGKSRQPPQAQHPQQGNGRHAAAGQSHNDIGRTAQAERSDPTDARHASTDRAQHDRPRRTPAARPDHGNARHAPGNRPDYGNARHQPAERPEHGNARNTPANRPDYGGARNMPANRPDYGNARNMPAERPEHGNARNMPGNRPDYGNARHTPAERPEHGNARYTPANRPEQGNARHTPGNRPDYGNAQQKPGNRPEHGNYGNQRSAADPQHPQNSGWGAQTPRQGDGPPSSSPARRRHRGPTRP
jgi:RIO kinase 1